MDTSPINRGCRARFARRAVGGGGTSPALFLASSPREVTLHTSLPSFTSSVAANHVQTCVKRPFSIVFTREWRRIRVPIPTQPPFMRGLSECVPVRPRSRRDASRFPMAGSGGFRRRVCPYGHGPNRVSRGKSGPIRNRREKDSTSPFLKRGFARIRQTESIADQRRLPEIGILSRRAAARSTAESSRTRSRAQSDPCASGNCGR